LTKDFSLHFTIKYPETKKLTQMEEVTVVYVKIPRSEGKIDQHAVTGNDPMFFCKPFWYASHYQSLYIYTQQSTSYISLYKQRALKKISVMHVIKLGFAPVSFPPG
jgi:hypothetical protein